MIYKINGVNVTLDNLLLKIHDRYVSVEDISFLDRKLTLGVYEKKWKKLNKFGTMTLNPVKSYFFKDSERICYYSINEFRTIENGISIILNENNVVYMNFDSSIPTIELINEGKG